MQLFFGSIASEVFNVCGKVTQTHIQNDAKATLVEVFKEALINDAQILLTRAEGATCQIYRCLLSFIQFLLGQSNKKLVCFGLSVAKLFV